MQDCVTVLGSVMWGLGSLREEEALLTEGVCVFEPSLRLSVVSDLDLSSRISRKLVIP